VRAGRPTGEMPKTRDAVSTVLDALTKRQRELGTLAHDFQLLRSFASELQRTTKGKPFAIRNDLAWAGIVSLRRTIVIDLAGWVRSVCDPWLRKTLDGPSLVSLRASKRLAAKIVEGSVILPVLGGADVTGRIRGYQASTVEDGRRRALTRLFGKEAARRGHATSEDVLHLEDTLRRWVTDLDALRNREAHPFTFKGDIKELGLADLARRFTYCGRVLNDLRLLLDSSTYLMPRLEASNDPRCRDLVDLIVVGTIEFAVMQWTKCPNPPHFSTDRDAHYRRMHARRRTKKTAPFNGPLPPPARA
jgi:hypothetical protein